MKRLSIAVLLLFLTLPSLQAATWLTDYNAALQAAAAQNRPVLIDFTGSDWCGWCIKLRKEVFDKPEFAQFADSKLILLEVDFPNNKPQSAALQRANQALQQKYGVRGYPTLFLVDAKGNVMQQLGYMEGGPKVFLAELNKGLNQKGSPPAADNAPTPLVQTGPAVKVVYDKLILKGITGSATRPVALINNKTFSPGDTLKVQVGEQTMKVRCESITADYVMVLVDEEKEPRKLVLGTK
jgi:protein disulfide-isomerase